MIDVIWLVLFGIAILILLAIEITFLGGWKYLKNYFKFGGSIKETPTTTPSIFKKTILINFHNKKIKYNGKEDLPDNKIGLYDDNLLANTIISYDELTLTNESKKRILEGKDDVIEFVIDNNININAQLNAYRIQIAKLENDLINMAKSYHSVVLEIDKEKRKSWDALNKGRKIFFYPRSGNNQQQMIEDEEV